MHEWNKALDEAIKVLKEFHERDKHSHNYFLFSANRIAELKKTPDSDCNGK